MCRQIVNKQFKMPKNKGGGGKAKGGAKGAEGGGDSKQSKGGNSVKV
jgi:hypothetical protein